MTISSLALSSAPGTPLAPGDARRIIRGDTLFCWLCARLDEQQPRVRIDKRTAAYCWQLVKDFSREKVFVAAPITSLRLEQVVARGRRRGDRGVLIGEALLSQLGHLGDFHQQLDRPSYVDLQSGLEGLHWAWETDEGMLSVESANRCLRYRSTDALTADYAVTIDVLIPLG